MMEKEMERLQELIDVANEVAIDMVSLRDRLLSFKGVFYGHDYGRLYQIQFPYFFKGMLDEMDRHYPTQGDSYHECSVQDLEELLDDVIEAYRRLGNDYPRKASQTIDIANVCAMLNQRLCGI